MRSVNITFRAAVFILGILGIAAVLSYLVFTRYVEDYERHQKELAEQAIRSVISELDTTLNEIKRGTRLFVFHNKDLIWEMSQNPENEVTYSKIEKLLREHFPEEYYSFTISDREGNLIYDDFGETIGPLCRRNIQQALEARNKSSVVVHPGPGEYHIDIMVPWKYENVQQGIFFQSYRLDVVSRLLQFAQPAQHWLVLTRHDDPQLIEITSQGGRDVVQRSRSNRLTDSEMSRIAYQQRVEGTEWLLSDIYDEGLLDSYRQRLWRPLIGAWATVLLLSMMSLFIINREERRRNLTEAKLRRSHDLLEEAVNERTQELVKTNQQLKEEMMRRDRAESMQKIFTRAASQSSEIIFITDTNGTYEYVNPCFERATGYTSVEAVGRPGDLLKSGVMSVGFYRDLWETITDKKTFSAVFVNRKKDGELIYMDETITPLIDEEGNIEHYIATARDVTEDKSNQERLRYISDHDLLTNLFNRSYFERHVAEIISADPLRRRNFALIYIDIDRFDKVSAGLGHQAGDLILIELSRRMQVICKEYDMLARFGGDEFIIMLDSVTTAEEVLPELERVLHSLNKAVTIKGEPVTLTGSLGVALYPTDGETYEVLTKGAFAAVKRAKDAGGNCYEFYQEGMTDSATARLLLERQLNKAVENKDLTFSYQPKIMTSTGGLYGFELLSRWVNSETGQATSPAIFIPILEENGLISTLWSHAMEDACGMLAKPLNDIAPEINIAMNLSSRQLSDFRLVDQIKRFLDEYELQASALEFEITESMLIENIDRAIKTLEGIKALGCKLAIDDFGTGYSSMQYLKSLPLDAIKIDKSFTSEIHIDSNDQIFVKTIIDMAHTLGMYSVAEGVENQEQYDELVKLGCDQVQGYFISKPVPVHELVAWVTSYQPLKQ
jgi:diguanylate cyclase (GGDEF)-like protein/PAS domain S-box-containing protein